MENISKQIKRKNFIKDFNKTCFLLWNDYIETGRYEQHKTRQIPKSFGLPVVEALFPWFESELADRSTEQLEPINENKPVCMNIKLNLKMFLHKLIRLFNCTDKPELFKAQINVIIYFKHFTFCNSLFIKNRTVYWTK